MTRLALPLVAGVLFGAGLVVGGMTQPENVLAFLDVTGAWDPALAGVMGGAIAVHALAQRWSAAWPSPWSGGRFTLPTRSDLDGRLIGGAVLFGLGWGLVGYCPGPAVAVLPAGDPGAWTFFLAMITGMGLYALVERSGGGSPAGPG